MLYAGSDDGVYRIAGVPEPGETTAEKVLDAEQVYRVAVFDGIDGFFATSESGLYHSPDGDDWQRLPVPEEQVYAVTASPGGERVYAGTRPSGLFIADWSAGVPTDPDDWTAVEGFRQLRANADWGIPRHDGVAQVRSLRTHPDAPDRIVAGVEVGGVHVSDDGGETWDDRRIEGFDAPHTDDIHHVALGDSETFVASTGSGLYRSTDAGRTWTRLDTGYDQRYVREAVVHDGVVYAGVAPSSSSSWAEDDDHVLVTSRDGESADPVDWPTPEAVAIGWCVVDGDPVAANHQGTLLRRGAEGWTRVGTVPTAGSVRGRYLPLLWDGS
ncbi:MULTISPECIES: WD40/YVTN/BNR-like repeat-containing protein [Salinibaculum]|uniref:WD40/YVTN/BNR-like repeat-containing protein n=1 Tax=Salinibaculum TaxID=2732368 RepID=UPI0030CC2123